MTKQPSLASSDAWYKTITPAEDSDLCIDLPGGDVRNGNPLWLWECNGQDSQIWVFDNYQIRYGPDESFCIDAYDELFVPGTQLILWECNGHPQQTWGYDGDALKVYIIDRSTCFDWSEANYDWGQQMHIWDCNDQLNQQWYLWDAGTPSVFQSHVFPADHCQYDAGGWPSFGSEQDLQNDPYWSAYFQNVYGGVPSWGYPICPGAFQFLWQISAANTGVYQGDPTDCTGGTDGSGQELAPGTYYTGNSFLEAKDVYGYIYNPNFYGSWVPANTWVEVTHSVFPGDVGAIWYYMSVGSGVWFNVGNTAVYDDHSSGVLDLLGDICRDETQDTSGSFPTECEVNFPFLYPAALARGLNSVQFTSHHDCTCGPAGDSSYKYFRWCPTEIIALDDPDGAALGCSDMLAGGWEASSGCNCDEGFKSTTKDPKCDSSTGGCSYANCGAY